MVICPAASPSALAVSVTEEAVSKDPAAAPIFAATGLSTATARPWKHKQPVRGQPSFMITKL